MARSFFIGVLSWGFFQAMNPLIGQASTETLAQWVTWGVFGAAFASTLWRALLARPERRGPTT